jgi:predicted MFS family arabinose efflux permease
MSPSSKRSWVPQPGVMAVVLLSLAYLTAFMDRMVISIVVEPIKTELSLSDTQIGLLTGFAYIFFYGIGAVAIARFADRYCRKCIVSLSILVWSVMTALTGIAQNFGQMLLLRMATGIGEAGIFPSGSSIVSDYFPAKKRSAAIAIFVSGSTLGLTVGLMLGGYIAERYGWRWAFIVLGLAGAPVALLTSMALREPQRGSVDPWEAPADRPGFIALCKTLLRNKTYVQIVLAACLLSFMAFGVIQWMPALMLRKFGLGVAEVGALFGVALGLGSALGTIIGGFLANRLAQHDIRWLVRMPFVVSFLYLPVYEFAIYAPNATWSMLAIFLINVVGGSSYGPLLGAMQSVVPPSIRATASAIYLCCMMVIGAGSAPLVIGVLSDRLRPTMGNTSALETALASAVAVTSTWALIHLYRSLRDFSRDFRGEACRSGSEQVVKPVPCADPRG